ncbi:MAG: hypothetical protein ACTSO9_16590, partial [Candidatus Helarchaeota archaeon]
YIPFETKNKFKIIEEDQNRKMEIQFDKSKEPLIVDNIQDPVEMKEIFGTKIVLSDADSIKNLIENSLNILNKNIR